MTYQHRITKLASVCLFFFTILAHAGTPFGIESRVTNTTLLIPDVPQGETIPEGFPVQLSDIPALLAAGLGQDQTGSGIYPYAPSAKLWSDGALKERFIALPGTSQMTYRAREGWDFPDGAVIIKNFLLPQDFRDPEGTAERIETRLMIKNAGTWHGFSYRWNEDESDAMLLADSDTRAFTLTDESGAPYDYDWQFPSRNACFRCHTVAANRVLGVNTAQMNADYAYPESGVTDNQLRAFDHIGLLAGGLPADPCQLPRAPDPEDDTQPVVARALAYLQANCAICHRPDGGTPTMMDLRWGTRLEARGILGVMPERGDLGIADARILKPGDPGGSVLVARIKELSAIHRMPPLATSRVDTAGVALMRAWITSQISLDGHIASFHTADTDFDSEIALSELLRVIQFYNTGQYHCDMSSEDGYAVGPGSLNCVTHAGDYQPADWFVSLAEVLRAVQFYNVGGYTGALYEDTEDGYLPGNPCAD